MGGRGQPAGQHGVQHVGFDGLAEDEGYLVFRKPVEPGVLHAVLARWLPTAPAPDDSGPAA